MPVVYYTLYESGSSSVPEISKLEHILGYRLLEKGLNDLHHLQINDLYEGAISLDRNGKPFLTNHPEICFNITHCDNFAACVFSATPIGIDAELPGYVPEILIGHALSDCEKDFLSIHSTELFQTQEWFWRFWTLKEAYFKRSGIGVDTDLTSVSFTFDASFSCSPNRFLPVGCSDPDVSCLQMKFSSGHILSLCCSEPASVVPVISYCLPHELPI